MRLHRFNDVGLRRIHEFLDALGADPALAVPTGLLMDPACVVAVAPAVDVEASNFENRMQAATYLDHLLSGVTSCDVSRDAGLWAWLTLFFFDEVCPADGHGRRKVGARARYVPEFTDFRKYYRHLLAGPYRIFRAHRDAPERALSMLRGPLDKPGEITEQIASRQELVTNPIAVEAVTKLYIQPESLRPRRGAAGRGPGSVRRLADVLNQFDLTWDLNSIQVTTLVDMLPHEFDRFQPSKS
jgi:hypothetical protein